MTTEIGNSNLIDTWAATGTIIEPDITKKNTGWTSGERPLHEYMNWLQNTFGQKINHMLSRGAVDWNATTPFMVGALVNHTGSLWVAVADNTNSVPSGANANWNEVATDIPTQATEVWEAGTDTNESLVSAAKVAAAIAALGGGVELLATAEITVAVSTVDFTAFDDTKYGSYFFAWDNLGRTSTGGLRARLSSNGGVSFDSGASDYAYSVIRASGTNGGNVTTSLSSDSSTLFLDGFGTVPEGSAGISGNLTINGTPSGKHTAVDFSTVINSNTVTYSMQGGGVRNASTVTNGLQFFASSGNLDAGTIRMYGVKK